MQWRGIAGRSRKSSVRSAPGLEDTPDAGTRARFEIITPALLLLGPLFHQLRLHGYPLFRLDVLLVAAGTVLVGTILGLAIHRARLPLRLAIIVLVLAIVWDLYGTGGSLQWAVISVGTVMLLVLTLRAHITTITFAVSIPVLLSTLLPPIDRVETTSGSWSAVPGNRELPPVFHFVLDEHGGFAGLADDPALVADLRAWYEERGFHVLPNAYSPYFDTYNALPNLVNFSTQPVDARNLHVSPGSPPAVRENRYFDAMRARGYGVRVYQSDYLDFCGGATPPALMSCLTYPANSLSYAAGMALPTPARARLLVHYLLANRSYFFDRALVLYDRRIRPTLANAGASATLGAGRGGRVSPPIGEVLDRIEQDLAHGAGGTLFFAHLLVPHYPYQYDATCRVRERLRDRLDRASPSAPEGMDNTPASRERRLALYGDQVRCLMRELSTFFGTLDSLGAYDPAVVILHGDHGSRIVLRRPEGRANVGQLTRQDLLDGYSTLFAVRAPGIPAGSDTVTAGIGELLSALVTAEFRVAELAPPRREPTVFIVDRPRGRMIPLAYPH